MAAASGSDASNPSYKLAFVNLPGTPTEASSTASESQRDASVFNLDENDKLVATLMPSGSLFAGSTTPTEGTGSGSDVRGGSGGSGSGSGSGNSETLGTTIQGYQRPPATLQQNPGSNVGSSPNGATSNNPYGATSNNPYYRVNSATTRPTGPKLTDTLLSNVVSIGSKFLSNLVNGDPNKIAAEAANPYSSSAYLAQYQAQQSQLAAAASARAAAAARASPVPGSAAYYAAQNANRVANGARVTDSALAGSATLTPAQIREAASRASRLSDYYKNHPSVGIVGTGLYRVQATATATTTSASTTPAPEQDIDPDSGEVGPSSEGLTSSQEAETEVDSSGTTDPASIATDTTLSDTTGTTCQVTAINAGNCNPNFRNKICDLGCTNNEQAAVSTLCQKNSCSVGVSTSFFLRSVDPISRKDGSDTDEPNPGNRPNSQLQSNHIHDGLSHNWRNGQRERPEILQQPHTQRSRRSLFHIHRQTCCAQDSHGRHYCSSHRPIRYASH